VVNDPGPNPAIFFLSDYGTTDEFVGVVHAVLHRLAPTRRVIDLSHQVPPFAVGAGAAMLVRCAPSLGAGVVLAVVDPGVGTGRRAVAIGTPGGGPTWLVGPDNGLLAPMAARLGGPERVIVLDRGRRRPDGSASAPGGSTFDGRDVFAPAAAHLAMGGAGEDLGTPVDPSSLVPGPPRSAQLEPAVGPLATGSTVLATVTWIDHFGNVQLGMGPAALDELGLPIGGTALATVQGEPGRGPISEASSPTPLVGGSTRVRRVGAFAELDPGECGLMVDANGQAALVLDRGSAARRLGVGGPGVAVRITSGDAQDTRA
jgi:S-adenosyl-L-methionine hydrolase (adenosine-forming)